MSRECNMEELEALVQGKLDPAVAGEVESHAASCQGCRDELAWLRKEAALMARRRDRQPPLAPSLWEGISARVAEPEIVSPEAALPGATVASAPTENAVTAASGAVVEMSSSPRRQHWGARVAFSVAVAAAAAALLFVAWPRGSQQIVAEGVDAAMAPTVAHARKKLSADAALDQAERENEEAMAVLEAQYKAKRGKLPPELQNRYDAMLRKEHAQMSTARMAAGTDVEGRMLVLDGYQEYLLSLQKIVSDIH